MTSRRIPAVLRAARFSDAKQIAQLHADSWRQNYRGMMDEAFLNGDVGSDRSRVWNDRLSLRPIHQFVSVAEHEDQLVGFVCAFGNEDPMWGSYIDNLHVARDYKRHGVGSALMAEAAEWLQSNYPRCGVYLWVMEANHAARRFYERLGAENAEVMFKEDPGGGSARNCRYVWSNPRGLSGAKR